MASSDLFEMNLSLHEMAVTRSVCRMGGAKLSPPQLLQTPFSKQSELWLFELTLN